MSLWGITELSDFDTGVGLQITDTTAGRFSSSFGVRGAVRTGDGGSSSYLPVGPGLGSFTAFGLRFMQFQANGVTARTPLILRNSVGTPVIRLENTSTLNVWNVQYWNGASWTTAFTAGATNGLLNTVDLYVTGLGTASGRIRLYIGNSQVGDSGTINLTSATNVDEIRFASNASNALDEWRISEVIWGDEPTIGCRFCFAPPTGNGTYTAGSGAFGDVDENGLDDADLSTLASSGDAETYTHGAMTLPTGTIKAVMINSRVRNSGAAPANVKARIRIGGTDYDAASNYSGIGLGFTPYRYRLGTNPAGGSWTATTAGQTSNEFGMVAAT